ncbi:MAG TPA: nuclear transport factor 2 family protein [Candidatus Thermoplasmatota archaeon]|nr:nuclear transport factor 2 family protein [Candidatus Thermoplasmatota archaeon]
MHPNAALVARFYDAFDRHDAEAMAVCYHKEVVFCDPVFGELHGERAADMWRMLCGRAKDLKIVASDIAADDTLGSARWVATYSFGPKARRVRNDIEARFEFREGLIARHEDSFPLWTWSRQALGPAGLLLGWTPMVQRRIRGDARRGLDAFVAQRSR